MRTLAFVILALALTSCGGSQRDLKGIGSGRDDMKQSPCACGPEIIQPNDRHATI